MSQLSEQLRLRDVDGACGQALEGHVSLESLDVGEPGVVAGVVDRDRPDAARRLFDLGFVPGVSVVKKRQDFWRNTFVIEIGGYEIAMRAAQARCIWVEPEAVA